MLGLVRSSARWATGTVPYLCPWIMHKDFHVRYVAIFALTHITGEPIHFSYFDEDLRGERRGDAIDVWMRWYASNPGSK